MKNLDVDGDGVVGMTYQLLLDLPLTSIHCTVSFGGMQTGQKTTHFISSLSVSLSRFTSLDPSTLAGAAIGVETDVSATLLSAVVSTTWLPPFLLLRFRLMAVL